jgi:hypothetical protein
MPRAANWPLRLPELMELLIPGLILVALMVYASTRIKRSAAAAYEAETIETDDFVIDKPEGFLHVLNGNPDFEFEAYSRDFDTIARRDIRLVTVNVVVNKDKVDDGAVKLTERTELIGDVHYTITEFDLREGGADFRIVRKHASRGESTFVFELKRLADIPDDILRKSDAMIDSFRLK